MKVATRITVATALVVAVASAIYAGFDLRARASEKRAAVEHEGHAVAATLRGQLEAQASAFRAPSETALKELSRQAGWKVSVFPRTRAGELPGAGSGSAVDGYEPMTSGQLRRLHAMLEGSGPLADLDPEGDFYFQSLPLRSARIANDGADDIQVVGMLEIMRPADAIANTSSDYMRAVGLVGLVVVVTTLMVGALATRFVSRPITKLLGGIDDVAKGDLSHVILSERDDEIGAIATRFNEMTSSLRESRGETQRQNEAKLMLEQRLGQTEKLATIGQLAAELAHEVGTPLNVIAARARSIQKKAKDPEAVEKNAAIVAEQTARITRIIQRLLDFTRRKVGATGRHEVALDDLIATTLELLAGQIHGARVRTRHERGPGGPAVQADSDRLQQVLINLLLNAVQAMPDGGTLSIETGTVARTRPGLEGSAEQRFATIAVRDTGVGIPDDIKDKIFDPFYTTKTGAGGTGLGLAVCSGIVKEHDGWIDVESVAGGTTFTVYLPA